MDRFPDRNRQSKIVVNSFCTEAILDGGPEPLRSRTGSERFGLMGLAGGKQELADHDSVLWLKNLRWMKKVKRKNEEADLLVEQPADPQSWKKDGDQQPTFLETEDMEELLKMFRVELDQGAVAHMIRKPTVLLTTMEPFRDLHGLRMEEKRSHWPQQVEERVRMSKKMASWAPGLVMAIDEVAQGLCQEKPQLKTMTAKDNQEVAQWLTLMLDMYLIEKTVWCAWRVVVVTVRDEE